MPAAQNPLHLGRGPRLFTSATDRLHTPYREVVLCLEGPPRLLAALWQVREEEESCKGERQGDDTVDDKKPSPSCSTFHSVQVCVGRSLKETAEDRTNRAREPEDHCSLADLTGCVPRSEEIVNTRIKSGSIARWVSFVAVLTKDELLTRKFQPENEGHRGPCRS